MREVESRDPGALMPTEGGVPRERSLTLDGDEAGDEAMSSALFDDHTRQELQSRWEAIQAEFVDEPRRSVEQADALVAETTERLADSFARTRGELEDGWKRGDDVSTEDLRRALRRYRSFFGRLVTTSEAAER